MDEMEMYRLIAAGLETKVEDDSGKAAVRSINLVIDLFEDVKALGEGITEDNAVEIADFLERIVGEVKAFGKSLSNQEE